MSEDHIVTMDGQDGSSDADDSDFEEIEVSGDDMTRLMALEEEISKQSNDYDKHVEVSTAIVGSWWNSTSELCHRTVVFGVRPSCSCRSFLRMWTGI